MKLPPLSKDALQRLKELGEQLMTKYQACDCDPLDYCEHKRKKMTRCNCDASCGENRYHDVGEPGCRFKTEEEHDSYWRNRRTPWMQKEWEENQKKLQQEMVRQEYEAHQARMPKEFPDLYPQENKPYLDEATRPWGYWCVLDYDQGYKVKRLEILPDQSISLQYHVHRAEIWNIVQGEGKVIVDGNIFKVSKGDTFVVPRQALHKITNTHLNETLVAIEVQLGEICSEDDIVRC